MKVALVVSVGANRGRSLTIRGNTFVIGRDPGCQLRADSESVSRRHCEILISETGVLLRDLGSMNGTFVNGVPVHDAVETLQDGDALEIGPLKFFIRITPQAEQSTAVMGVDGTVAEGVPPAPPVIEPSLETDTAEMSSGPPTTRVRKEEPSAEGISKAASDLIKKMLAKSPRRPPLGPGKP